VSRTYREFRLPTNKNEVFLVGKEMFEKRLGKLDKLLENLADIKENVL
jgi:hypothetical protein